MKRLFRSVLLLSFLATPASANNLVETGVDLSLRVGGVFGNIAEQDPVSQVVTPFGYGGFPIGVGYNKDLMRWLSLHVDIHFVLDPVNAQITRTGLDVGFAFHFMGGARRTFTQYGDSELMVRDPFNLSAVIRTGFHSYNATAQVGDASLTGSIFDNSLGIQYRFDTSPETAFSLEIFVPVYNLPAGAERITSSLISFFGSWRFYL